MPRNKLKDELCCVCLRNCSDVEIVKLTNKDKDQVDFLTKLCSSIPEIDWEPSFHICLFCTNLLDTVYTFHNTCLKSDEIRKKQLSADKNDSRRSKRHNEEDTINIKEEKNEDDQTHPMDTKEWAYVTNAEHNITSINYESIKQENNDVCDELSNRENDFILNNDADLPQHWSENSGDDATDENEQEDTVKSKKKKTSKRDSYEFKCEQCSFLSTSSIKLVDHCMTEHDMIPKDIRPFRCDRCPRKFCNSSNLMQHQKYHAAVRTNVCTYCGKGFVTKADLTTHEKHHLNKREYHCDECGKCFNTHKDVRSHKLVVHTDSSEWKHVCEVCDKRFPIKSNYDSHMRRHAGEKNFECHLCQRKFTDKCVMQRHMKTHSNVREHRCPECSKEYKDQRVMRIHMARIHNIGLGEIKLPTKERKYQCHICPKTYYAKNKLTRHLYVHSGEKPYSCSICDKKFNDKSYVKQHLKKYHRIESDVGDNVKWEVKQE